MAKSLVYDYDNPRTDQSKADTAGGRGENTEVAERVVKFDDQ